MSTISQIRPAPQGAPLFSGIGCYILWGVLPIYWKFLGTVSAPAILAHRIIWSLLFALLILLFMGRFSEVLAVFRKRGVLLRLLLSGFLVGCNWLTYIWAVNQGRILETSLGYFILPLLSMLLGIIVLRDRPRPMQIFGIICAAVGVAVQVITHGRIPLVALALACTFALYGLIRKTVDVESIPGLFVETLLLAPFAIIGLIIMAHNNGDAFLNSTTHTQLLLVGAGLVTTVPMILFAYSARRMSLVTLGILQYLAPLLAFFIGVFLYKEQLTSSMLITFSCIWLAIILYTLEGLRHIRHAKLHRKGV